VFREEAVKLFDVIETLDREKLAKALVKAAEKVGRMPRLLVQVNTGEEPQKAGIAPQDVGDFLSLLKDTYNITPEGLMCIPPMGEMSGDFETAIEIGATHIRVGSALFGERDYS